MNRTDFIRNYLNIAQRALYFMEKSKREGFLSLDDELDVEKINARDILEYGMRFVVDGTETGFIDNILSNIIEQEKDPQQKTLKLIQKAAVLALQGGVNQRMLLALLNSYTDFPLKDDEVNEIFEKEILKE